MTTDKIVQVSGFGVENTHSTQCHYMIVGVTESGDVVITTGDGNWTSIGPKSPVTVDDMKDLLDSDVNL